MEEAVGHKERAKIAFLLRRQRRILSSVKGGMLSERKTSDIISACPAAMDEIAEDPRENYGKFSQRAVKRVSENNPRTPDSRFLAVKQYLILECGVPPHEFEVSDFTQRYFALMRHKIIRIPRQEDVSGTYHLRPERRAVKDDDVEYVFSLTDCESSLGISKFEVTGFALRKIRNKISKAKVYGEAYRAPGCLQVIFKSPNAPFQTHAYFPEHLKPVEPKKNCSGVVQDLGSAQVIAETDTDVMSSIPHKICRVPSEEYVLHKLM